MTDDLKKEKWDEEIAKIKRLLEQLKRTQKSFTASFTSMRPRDRALVVRQILADHNTIANFITKTSRSNIGTTAFRFSVENIKLSYQSLTTLWRKTEKLLDSMCTSSEIGKPLKNPTDPDPSAQKIKIVNDYVTKLKNTGVVPNAKVIQTFQAQLESSYEKAKEKFKGKDFSVQIVEKDGKIKVRFEPK